MIFNVPISLALSALLLLLALGLLIRNNWVFARRTELNRFEGGVHVIDSYVDYDTMLLRFWVWDVEKFKTPNV